MECIVKRLMETASDLRGLLLIVLAGGWLAGILLSSWFALPQIGALIVAACGLVITGIFWQQPLPRIIGLVLLCLGLGAWRYAAVSPRNDPQAINAFIGAGKLELQAEIVAEPTLESNSTLLTVAVQSVSMNQGNTWREADGEIQVQALGATFDSPYAPRYGDTIQLAGSLTPPPSYTTPEIQASMAFPTLMITNRGGNPVLVTLYQVRTTLASILMQALPEPFAALLIAIFLSLRTPALKPLLKAFQVTGTAHLIAPSGFKVTLLSGLVSDGTGRLTFRPADQERSQLPAAQRRNTWQNWTRTLLLILCIAIYTFLSGAGPAALRAGIMGILLVLAPRLDRHYNVYSALALTALLMSLADSYVLWDVGFQLSFLGTLGIVFFTPFIQRPLGFLDRLPLGHHLTEIIAVTLAAQIATLPIFMLSFGQISFVAALANMLSVPLLSALLFLGTLIGLTGLLSAQLGLLCGWLAYPLLWYVVTVTSWCAGLPNAYKLVQNVNPTLAWLYYALLAGLGILLFTRWGSLLSTQQPHLPPLLSRNTRRIVLGGLALLTILATAGMSQAAQPGTYLTITLLTTGNSTQGEALLLRTPDGQTALIDEGADSTTLAQTLDTHLPFWQRSLNLAVLTDPSANNLSGLQDIITRYQVDQVVDAGMLHPSVGYALWRSTLRTRNLPYTQVRQGALIRLGNQVAFQVLWPLATLHKSSNETDDNALILRLLAPGLTMLLLNTAALSNYALQMLPTSLAPTLLQAQIVQITGQANKSFPKALSAFLTSIHPSLLLVTDVPARKSPKTTNTTSALPTPPTGAWKILQGQQTGPLVLQSNAHGWSVSQ
jgi:competence protein ComEC